MTAPLRLVLVRHGETAWSASGRHTGITELSLTPAGEAMARDLAPKLQGLAFTRVFTSPSLRARSTCTLAGLGEGAQLEPLLAEWDYGEYEGLNTTEIQAQRPGWDLWADGCPAGEQPADAGDRADRLIARLSRLSGPVALFSHGQFGRVLAARWIGLPVAQGRHFALAPASVGILGFEAAHPQRRVIALWNATATAFASAQTPPTEARRLGHPQPT